MKKFFTIHNKGFTLIELLVVIAIIGLLSAVVLASLNTARNKGSDTAVKANLVNLRSQGEIFYEIGNTYTGVCTNAKFLQGLNAAGGVCFATSGNGWIATAPLKAGGFWCVDSSGASKSTTTAALSGGEPQSLGAVGCR
jgi:prepilin-type N-terminal cleavage/methylation domain-containing protein